jgi:hypothetical protein
MSQWHHNYPDYDGTYNDYVNLMQNRFAKLEIEADEKGHIEEEKAERERNHKLCYKIEKKV